MSLRTNFLLSLALLGGATGAVAEQAPENPFGIRTPELEDCESFEDEEEQGHCRYRNTKRLKAYNRLVGMATTRRARQVSRTTFRIDLDKVPSRGRGRGRAGRGRAKARPAVYRLEVFARAADRWSYETQGAIPVTVTVRDTRRRKAVKRWILSVEGQVTDQEQRVGRVMRFRQPARPGIYTVEVAYDGQTKVTTRFKVGRRARRSPRVRRRALVKHHVVAAPAPAVSATAETVWGCSSEAGNAQVAFVIENAEATEAILGPLEVLEAGQPRAFEVVPDPDGLSLAPGASMQLVATGSFGPGTAVRGARMKIGDRVVSLTSWRERNPCPAFDGLFGLAIP